MTLKLIPVSAAAALLLSSAVQAASITNRDDVDYTITVVEANARKDHVLKPSAVLDGICPQGCVVNLSGKTEDDPYELEGSDVISIEGGEFWQDKVDPPDASASDAEGQPSKSTPEP